MGKVRIERATIQAIFSELNSLKARIQENEKEPSTEVKKEMEMFALRVLRGEANVDPREIEILPKILELLKDYS